MTSPGPAKGQMGPVARVKVPSLGSLLRFGRCGRGCGHCLFQDLLLFIVYCFFVLFWLHHTACGVSVP